ncbi:MAG: hypothetical protein LBT09_00825 [Planctomycetaceae bacterium]|jgi:hypothetical protein|nr:hypothetical protein [Planctomycetaceae bacterium]
MFGGCDNPPVQKVERRREITPNAYSTFSQKIKNEFNKRFSVTLIQKTENFELDEGALSLSIG